MPDLQKLCTLCRCHFLKFLTCLLVLTSQFILSKTNAESNVVINTTALWQQPSEGFTTGWPFTPLRFFNGSVYFVWVDSNFRPWVTKITNEVVQTVPLDAPDYQVQPDAHHRFSIGIDTEGYLHITGDMHNYNAMTTGVINPYPLRYQKQQILYWKSNQPENVGAGFYFAGDLNATTAIPGSGWTYGRFFNDNNGLLYFSALMHAIEYGNYAGEMGVGLYSYNTTTQTWTAIGGLAGPLPTGTLYNKTFYWEQSGFATVGDWFQGYRPNFYFDANNFMHFSCAVNTSTAYSGNDSVIYAFSPDGGITWMKANGTVIPALPIRGAAGTADQGDVVYSNPTANLGADSAIVVDTNNVLSVNIGGGAWQTWNTNQWVPSSILNYGVMQVANFATMGPNNDLLLCMMGSAKLIKMQTSTSPALGYDLTLGANYPEYDTFQSIDQLTYKKTGVVYGVAVNNATQAETILQTTFSAAPLPSGWADIDIAYPALSYGGSAGYYNGTFTVLNYGSAIGNRSDGFHFVYQEVQGDCTITALVNTTENSTEGYCRAGVMIRETLTAPSRDAYMLIAPGTNNKGSDFGYRSATGGWATDVFAAGITNPYWVRLERAGNTFTGYISSDCINWTQSGTANIPMNQSVYIGLAACAYTDGYFMEQVNFSNVTVNN